MNSVDVHTTSHPILPLPQAPLTLQVARVLGVCTHERARAFVDLRHNDDDMWSALGDDANRCRVCTGRFVQSVHMYTS